MVGFVLGVTISMSIFLFYKIFYTNTMENNSNRILINSGLLGYGEWVEYRIIKRRGDMILVYLPETCPTINAWVCLSEVKYRFINERS